MLRSSVVSLRPLLRCVGPRSPLYVSLFPLHRLDFGVLWCSGAFLVEVKTYDVIAYCIFEITSVFHIIAFSLCTRNVAQQHNRLYSTHHTTHIFYAFPFLYMKEVPIPLAGDLQARVAEARTPDTRLLRDHNVQRRSHYKVAMK